MFVGQKVTFVITPNEEQLEGQIVEIDWSDEVIWGLHKANSLLVVDKDKVQYRIPVSNLRYTEAFIMFEDSYLKPFVRN